MREKEWNRTAKKGLVESIENEQEMIRGWFDQTYRKKGLDYLRPVEAYGIYTKLLDLRPEDRFLDVACGPGLMLNRATGVGAESHGVDISEVAIGMAEYFAPEASVEVANAEALPYPSAYFDAVTCLGSLERMLDLDRVLTELYRVGRPGCRYAFLVRNSGNYTWRHILARFSLVNREGHQGAKSLAEWDTLWRSHRFEVTRVLPDQWPFVRWGQLLSLGLHKPNPMQVRTGVRSLEQAYEFLFVLRKQDQFAKEPIA